jgi:hypothetical protein
MLRGWLSLFKQEVAVVLEGLIVKMEIIKALGTDRVEGGDGNGYIIIIGSIGVSVFNSCQK